MAGGRWEKLLGWGAVAPWIVLGLGLVVFGAWFVRAAGGPLAAWAEGGFWRPPHHRLALWLPWNRKHILRDFSTTLAWLLDAHVDEPEAVRMAARSTVNWVFIERAAEAVGDLRSGKSLPGALRRVDATGELTWRIGLAARSGTGMIEALRGWHEMLEARAFHQEQVASQILATGFVLANGVCVGLLAAGVFSFLCEIVDHFAL